MAKAQLFYFVFSENLVYWNEPTRNWRYVSAMSGGGRGQKLGKKALPHGVGGSRVFTSLSETNRTSGAHRGGPLPHGSYSVDPARPHNFGTTAKPHMVKACELKPLGQRMFGRNHFFIHGQGAVGSDGCIVPTFGRVHVIFDLIAAHGGGWLHVETHERQGVDFDRHAALRAASVA
jgi:hypothetical protein